MLVGQRVRRGKLLMNGIFFAFLQWSTLYTGTPLPVHQKVSTERTITPTLCHLCSFTGQPPLRVEQRTNLIFVYKAAISLPEDYYLPDSILFHPAKYE